MSLALFLTSTLRKIKNMYPKAATFDKVARLQSPTFCWHEYSVFFFTSVRPSPFSSFSVECVSFFSVGWSDEKKKKKKKKKFIEITRILRIGGLKPQHHCRGTCRHNTWLLPNQHELSMVEYGRKLYDGRFHSFIHSFIFAINQKYNNSIQKFIIYWR